MPESDIGYDQKRTYPPEMRGMAQMTITTLDKAYAKRVSMIWKQVLTGLVTNTEGILYKQMGFCSCLRVDRHTRKRVIRHHG